MPAMVGVDAGGGGGGRGFKGADWLGEEWERVQFFFFFCGFDSVSPVDDGGESNQCDGKKRRSPMGKIWKN